MDPRVSLPVGLLVLIIIMGTGVTGQQQISCTTQSRHINGPSFTAVCPGGCATSGSVWGTAIYTDDSRVCRAAIHDGRIPTTGGVVSVNKLPGRSSYQASTQNGITTSSYGAWGGSFAFSQSASSRVDGGWTDWSPWSTCSVTCGVGTETRGRTCTNPAPANGGADCDGLDQDTQDCDTGVLCPVDGGWTDWSPWSACSVTCGVGTETRDRTCTNPAPANGGADCDGLDQDTQDCDTGVLCPVDGGWTDWSPWSACSVTCGVGTETRDRTCTNPAPANGGVMDWIRRHKTVTRECSVQLFAAG
ncbi:properdin-like [Branchiostoma floridae x Branchiostoma belcheri]